MAQKINTMLDDYLLDRAKSKPKAELEPPPPPKSTWPGRKRGRPRVQWAKRLTVHVGTRVTTRTGQLLNQWAQADSRTVSSLVCKLLDRAVDRWVKEEEE